MISYFEWKMLNYTILLKILLLGEIITIILLKELIKSLTSEPGKSVQWFKENMMIVNLDKFQTIIIDRKKPTK